MKRRQLLQAFGVAGATLLVRPATPAGENRGAAS